MHTFMNERNNARDAYVLLDHELVEASTCSALAAQCNTGRLCDFSAYQKFASSSALRGLGIMAKKDPNRRHTDCVFVFQAAVGGALMHTFFVQYNVCMKWSAWWIPTWVPVWKLQMACFGWLPQPSDQENTQTLLECVRLTGLHA